MGGQLTGRRGKLGCYGKACVKLVQLNAGWYHKKCCELLREMDFWLTALYFSAFPFSRCIKRRE
jgi:hypothetical protein